MSFLKFNPAGPSRLAILAVALFAVMSGERVHADAIIGFGVDEGGTVFIDLLAETSNQAVQFSVVGLDTVGGANALEFDIQSGDGGSDFGGTNVSPLITSVDLETGSIFTQGTQQNVADFGRAKQVTIDQGPLVTTDGLIATVVFDTTGIAPGQYEIRLNNVLPGSGPFNTRFLNSGNTLATTSRNGFFRIAAVPEPASAVFAATGLLVVTLRRRRHKK